MFFGSAVQLSVLNAQELLRLDPGSVLDLAGLLMGQVTVVGHHAPAQVAVPNAGLGHAVIEDAADMGFRGGGNGDGGGIGDGAGDVLTQ